MPRATIARSSTSRRSIEAQLRKNEFWAMCAHELRRERCVI
jgi:hypothetical protein